MNTFFVSLERVGTSALTSNSFMFAIDGVIVVHDIEDPLTAVGLLFGSFYIFNLHYPASASVTLEFIHRLRACFIIFTTDYYVCELAKLACDQLGCILF